MLEMAPIIDILRQPHCLRSKDSLPLLHPTAGPLVRGSDDALVYVDDLAFRLKELYIFGRGHLALEQVLMVVVVLPDDINLSIAHP